MLRLHACTINCNIARYHNALRHKIRVTFIFTKIYIINK